MFLNKKELFGYDTQIWILAVCSFVNYFGISTAYPFISLYLYQYRNIPMTSIGFALMVAAIVGGISQLIGGDLSDRLGRKKVMNAGIFLQIIAFLLLAYAIYSSAEYYAFLLIFSFIEISGGLYRNVPFVMAGDIVKEGDRSGAFSLLQIGNNLGLSVGPIFGGLITTFSYPGLFILAAATNLLFLIISIILLKDTRIVENINKATTKYSEIIKNKAFILFCAISCLISIVYAQKLTTVSSFAGSFAHLSEAQIGILFSFSGLILVTLQYPMTRYFEKYDQILVLVISSILFAFGFGMLGLFMDFWFLAICIMIITFAEILYTPSLLSIVTKMSPVDSRGKYISISRVIGRSGYAFGPLIGGYLMDKFTGNIAYMWVSLGVIAIIGAIGYLLFIRFDNISN